MKLLRIGFFILLFGTPAFAQSDTPLDPATLDQKEFKAFLGKWQIQDESGKKKCTVVLKDDQTIGGMVIDVGKSCAKKFAVMADVANWQLNEGWEIVLHDATRKTLLRFYTPDNDYVSDPETDGIFTIIKK